MIYELLSICILPNDAICYYYVRSKADENRQEAQLCRETEKANVYSDRKQFRPTNDPIPVRDVQTDRQTDILTDMPTIANTAFA